MITDNNQKSGLYLANTIALVTLMSFEEILGSGGVKTILNRAKLSHLVDNYPPDNLNREFDFADYSAIIATLEDIYGSRGGRVMGLRVGRATRAHMYEKFGPKFGITNVAFKILPLPIKLRLAVNTLAKVFNSVSDQETTVVEHEDCYEYIVKQCPVCWGRQNADEPVCYVTTGLIKGGLHWISNGREFDVKEVKCHAMGDEHCVFHIPKDPIE